MSSTDSINNDDSVSSKSPVSLSKNKQQKADGLQVMTLGMIGKQQSSFYKDDNQENDMEQAQVNIDYKQKFKNVTDEFSEMIAYMDFSFERAFDRKDKDFMIAYRSHVDQILKDIESLKSDANDQKYLDLKKQKLAQLESKLGKIRECAMFLGEMSELHKKKIKQMKIKIDEEDSDKAFLEKQIEKQRNLNKQNKDNLAEATTEYDDLYKMAQEFIQNSKDHKKINELLSLLKESERERLLSDTQQQKKQKDLESQEYKSKMQKYNNPKLTNFVQTLWDMGVSKDQFCSEIERYFFYHSLRKTNLQKTLEDQLQHEQLTQRRINSKKDQNTHNNKQMPDNELFRIFVQHIQELKEEMRQRKTLNQLKNLKSIKIRTDQIDIPDLTSFNISQFKSQDKKRLLEKFIEDDRVQNILRRILQQQQNQVQRLMVEQHYQSNPINNSMSNHYQTQQNGNLYDKIMNEPLENLINNRSFTHQNRLLSNYQSSRLYSAQRKQFLTTGQPQNQQSSQALFSVGGNSNNQVSQNLTNPQMFYSNAPIIHNNSRRTQNYLSNNNNNKKQQERRPKSSMPFNNKMNRSYLNNSGNTIYQDQQQIVYRPITAINM